MSGGTMNGNGGNHYQELNKHYAEECSQDDIGSFLFTSESVGEGHPGKLSEKKDVLSCGISDILLITWFCLCFAIARQILL